MSSSIPQTSGIYKIVFLPTGRVYVGSAINLRKRRREHWAALRYRRHDNAHLQYAWNKYGEQSFAFEIIELVLAPFLLEREQYWIDKLGAATQRKGFNMCPIAFSTLGRPRSEETKRKIGDGHRGRKFTPEAIESRRGAQNELWQDADYRRRMADAHAGRWVVVDPSGKEHIVLNLRRFCREHGLDAAHMADVAKGYKRRQHKGWRCRRADTEV